MKAFKLSPVLSKLGVIAAVVFISNSALSEDVKPLENMDDWELELGGVALFSPDYEGSDDYEPSALPYFHTAWKDTVVLTTRGGAPGLYVQGEFWDNFSVSAGVNYEFGRSDDDNDALNGLGDLDVGAVAVGTLGYELGPLEFSAQLSKDLAGDREGTQIKIGAEYTAMVLDNRGRFSIGPSLSWADENYTDNTFGISASQAASSRNNYSTFDAENGIKDVGIGTSFSYNMAENVSVLVSGNYTRLVGDAADSPLVEDEGSANQFLGMMGLIYRW